MTVQKQIVTETSEKLSDDPIDAGENTLMARFDDSLGVIRRIIKKADYAERTHQQRLQKALIAIYGLGCLISKEAETTSDLWKKFYLARGHRWDKRSQANPFHHLVTMCFGEDRREDALSKYRAILRYAAQRQWVDDQLEQLLREGIEKAYNTAIAFAKRDLEAIYRETDIERFDRARLEIKEQKIGSAIALPTGKMPPKMVRDYSTALVRWNQGNIELVDFIANQTEGDIQTAVSELVGAEGARVRKKLKAKSLYWFFAIVDVFERFVLDKNRGEEIQLAHSAAQSKLGDIEDPNSEEFKQEILKSIKRAKNKPKPQTALRLSKDGNGWLAETVSSYPAFPVVQARFDAKGMKELFPEELFVDFDPNDHLLLTTQRARSFLEGFLEFNDWSIENDQQEFRLTCGNPDVPDRPLDPITHWQHKDHPWRHLRGDFQETLEFTTDAGELFDILTWKAGHKARKRFGRNIPFPKILTIMSDQKDLRLEFPRDREFSKKLGSLVGEEQTEQKTDTTVLARIAHEDIENIARFSEDYRVTFGGCLLRGAHGIQAMQFRAIGFQCDLTVTVPLITSNQGDVAEISQLIAV